MSQGLKVKVLAKLHLFLKSLRDNTFPCVFQLLETTCGPWFTASFLLLSSRTLKLLQSYLRVTVSLQLDFLFPIWGLWWFYWMQPSQSRIFFLSYGPLISKFHAIFNLKSPLSCTKIYCISIPNIFTDSRDQYVNIVREGALLGLPWVVVANFLHYKALSFTFSHSHLKNFF